jgi:ankyrin repeat protein
VCATLNRHRKALDLVRGGCKSAIVRSETNPPLQIAIYNTQLAVANLLIDAEPDVSAPGPQQGTPLHYAVLKRIASLIHTLVEKGAYPNVQDAKGWTALRQALSVSPAQYDTVRTLPGHHADPTIPDDGGNACLHVAVRNQSDSILELLAPQCSSMDQFNNGGLTALHLAAAKRSKELVQSLLRQGAGVNE